VNGFELKRDGNRIDVVFEGDLTASVVPELRPALQNALEEGALEVEFDLANTTVIDSTGIGVLIAAYNSFMAKGGAAVRVVRVSDDIFRLLQSMRLEKRLCVSKR